MNLTIRRLLFSVFISVSWLFNLSAINVGETANSKQITKTVKILTVGNSFADNACTYLPQIAGSIPGMSVKITKANLGGCSLERHVTLMKECDNNSGLKPYSNAYCLKDLLEMDTYDFVTVQQASPLSFKLESFQPYAGLLINFIRLHSPRSEILIHQTWAYGTDSPRLKEWNMSREQMHNSLIENYRTLAKQYNLDILPSGSAFYAAKLKDQKIDLWNKDRYHANINGCYLAGCVWFGRIFGISPKKISFLPEGMDKNTAEFLRKIADKELKRQKSID
jgi:hypothetical protein